MTEHLVQYFQTMHRYHNNLRYYDTCTWYHVSNSILFGNDGAHDIETLELYTMVETISSGCFDRLAGSTMQAVHVCI